MISSIEYRKIEAAAGAAKGIVSLLDDSESCSALEVLSKVRVAQQWLESLVCPVLADLAAEAMRAEMLADTLRAATDAQAVAAHK